MEWAARYREQGPMPLSNANLHEKVLQRIRRIKTVPVFAISYGDMATYEFLSSGEVWPFHAVRMTEDYERFPTLIAMMKYLRHGALVVTLSDQWSSWYHNWGPLDPQQVIRDALAQGIKVEYEPIYLRAEQEVGLFSFSVAGEEANR
jgi:hypothetical protein